MRGLFQTDHALSHLFMKVKKVKLVRTKWHLLSMIMALTRMHCLIAVVPCTDLKQSDLGDILLRI